MSNISAVGPLPEHYRGANIFEKVARENGASSEPVRGGPGVANAASRIAKLPQVTGNAGFWVARRMDYTEEDNPIHLFVMMNAGAVVGSLLQCRQLDPTALEIADALASTATQVVSVPEFSRWTVCNLSRN